MELIRPKIELYRTRTFSDKISDTFGFIRETWRPLLKYFIYFMLPVSIFMGFFTDHFFSGYMAMIEGMMDNRTGENSILSFALMSVGTGILNCVGMVLLTGLTYALMRLYLVRDDRLDGLAATDLRPELMHCIGRSVRLILAGLVIDLLSGLLFALFFFALFPVGRVVVVLGAVLLFVLFFVLIVPLMLTMPVYMMEDGIGIIEALQKAWRLGFATWGGIIAVTLVLGLIGMTLQTVTLTPWYVMSLFKTLFTLRGEGGGFVASAGYSFLQYLSCVWMCLGYMLVYVLGIVGITIQYGHASDKVDGTGVARQIEHFDELDSF